MFQKDSRTVGEMYHDFLLAETEILKKNAMKGEHFYDGHSFRDSFTFLSDRLSMIVDCSIPKNLWSEGG